MTAEIAILNKPVRKFTSYAEYVREFFPDAKDNAADEHDSGDELGVALAMGSLTKHAEILRFGRQDRNLA